MEKTVFISLPIEDLQTVIIDCVDIPFKLTTIFRVKLTTYFQVAI
jgi:hypothetical protein